MSEILSALTERFCRYVAISSQSDASQLSVPSTSGQLVLAQLLADELQKLQLSDVHIDENGILTAWCKGNLPSAPKIGFVTHLDTVDVGLSADIKPQILHFDGSSLCLNETLNIWISPEDRPELNAYLGQDILFSDGTSVLGSDDKAAVTVVMQLLQQLQENPFDCGDIYVAFVPDEEIGLRGAKRLDLQRFAVDFAYTIDATETGELVYETFNAALAVVTIKGVPAHPISAKGILVNPILVACDLISRFDPLETPEHTEGREGYFYVTDIQAGPAQAKVHINIRDFDKAGYEARKHLVKKYIEQTQAAHPGAHIDYQIEDVYSNILDAMGENQQALILLERAFEVQGIQPKVLPMRGGTDGSALSARGIFTPNYFTGAHNFHASFEFLPLNAFLKSYQVTESLVRLGASEDWPSK